MQVFTIPVRMPGLNEIIAKAKSGHGKMNAYARMKKEFTDIVKYAIMQANIKPTERVFIDFLWIEKNKKRDPDNIACGRKFVLDGLIKAGIIEDDGWQQIAGWKDEFKTGDPGVVITLWEM